MSDQQDNLPSVRDPVLNNQIDSLCDDFERALRAGNTPCMNDFVAGVPEAARGWLHDVARNSPQEHTGKFPGMSNKLQRLCRMRIRASYAGEEP